MVIDTNKNVLSIIFNAINYAEAEDSYADYEIELGKEVWNQIIWENTIAYSAILIHNNKDERATLYGKPVRINYEDPYIFKLWKRIV